MDLIKRSEGCRLTAYQDGAGVWTIGWGYTGPDVHEGLTWSQAQADAELMERINRACDEMAALVKVPLVQGQVDALTDFVYNEGSGTLQLSTLLILLNAGRYSQVPNELYHEDAEGNPHGYVFAGGHVEPGLIARRKAEIALWNS